MSTMLRSRTICSPPPSVPLRAPTTTKRVPSTPPCWICCCPVIVLIALCIVGLVWTGGMWDAESDNYGNFVMSFSDASAGTGLCLGSIIALVFTFMYYWLRGLITFEKSMEAIPNGFIQMISPILILCFAWTLCGLCRDNGLQVGAFVEGVMANTGSLAKFLPP